MRGRGAGIAIRRVEHLFREGAAGGLSDGRLLDRFAATRDEASFAALVARHGPLVLGVCRRVLRDGHAAEDAFQATFLVLARKAGSIRVDDSLGRWLYTVSRRIALRALGDAECRGLAEAAGARPVAVVEDGPGRRELRAVLDEELGRLPDSYRAAMALCGPDGLTHEEAARRLGWPIGTVKGRLSRARRLLRGRLARRGLAPSAAAMAWASRPSVVSASLADGTVSAAIGFAAGRATAAGVAPAVAMLATGTLRMMHMTRIKLAAVGLMALGVGGVGIGSGRIPGTSPTPALADDGPATKPEARAGAADRPPATEGTKRPLPEYVVEPPDLIRVEVQEALPGRPITGERLVRPDGRISLGVYGDVYVAGLTTAAIKVKVIEHLRKHLDDEALGLVKKAGDRRVTVAPEDSVRVSVDVVAYNSKVYYVQGDVGSPGRMPVNGNETVLDAINNAGGLLPTADATKIKLVRPAAPGGGRERVLPVDFAAIVKAGDPRTNYQMLPGDRLIVERTTVPPPDAAERAARHRMEGRIDAMIRELEAFKTELGSPPVSRD